MRSVIPILILCLYTLNAAGTTTSSEKENAEFQQGNTKATALQNLWSVDENGKNDEDEKDNHRDHNYGDEGDECASRSVSVQIGTNTYAIPCLEDGFVVDLNGLLPSTTSTFSVVTSISTETSSSSSWSTSSFSASKSTESSSFATSEQPRSTGQSQTTTTSSYSSDIPTPTMTCEKDLDGVEVCALPTRLPYFYTCDSGVLGYP